MRRPAHRVGPLRWPVRLVLVLGLALSPGPLGLVPSIDRARVQRLDIICFPTKAVNEGSTPIPRSHQMAPLVSALLLPSLHNSARSMPLSWPTCGPHHSQRSPPHPRCPRRTERIWGLICPSIMFTVRSDYRSVPQADVRPETLCRGHCAVATLNARPRISWPRESPRGALRSIGKSLC